MANNSIPSAEVLNTASYTFTENENNIVFLTFHAVEDKLDEVLIFNTCDQTGKEHLRLTVLNFIRWFVNKCSRRDGLCFFIPFSDNGQDAAYLTSRQASFVYIVSDYIIFNLSENGLFTEYWEPLQIDFINNYLQPMDIIFYTSTIDVSSSNSFMSDLLESTFEENREQTLEQLYGEHQDHTLNFSSQPPISRTEEISECQLCCEPADYVCSKCNEPLCCSCIMHLKKSTNSCPACRVEPIVLNRIEGGEEFSTWIKSKK